MKRFQLKTTLLLMLPALGLLGFAVLNSINNNNSSVSVATNKIAWQPLPTGFSDSSIKDSNAFAHQVVVRYSTSSLAAFPPFPNDKRLDCTSTLTDARGTNINGGNGIEINVLGRYEGIGFYDDPILQSVKGPIMMCVRCQWNDETLTFDLAPQNWNYMSAKKNWYYQLIQDQKLNTPT